MPTVGFTAKDACMQMHVSSATSTRPSLAGSSPASARIEVGPSREREASMSEWITCGDAFIVADVVRWTEPAFAPQLTRWGQRRRRAKDICIGEREVIAEVLSDPDQRGFLRLLVRACRVVSSKSVRDVPMLRSEEEIRRRKSTLTKGKVHRLAWSDESARAVVVRDLIEGA